MASSTKAVTGFTVNSIRTNEDGSVVLVATVTYADATTDVIELIVDKLTP